jgi:hypothetical protein
MVKMRGWWLIGVLLAAGCAPDSAMVRPQPVAPQKAPKPGDLTALQQCQASLDEFGIDFKQVPSFSNAKGCGMADGVKVATGGVDLNRPAELSCDLAVAFANFEYEFIQPLALRHLRQPVTRVWHAGTYDCREVRNGGKAKGLSQHAKGRAIDLTGFDVADGTVINIARDWRAPGPKADFLRAVAKRACERFDVVLTPDHDKDHHDHLHLDLSGKKFCG